jgi:DNA repair protein RecO (recombination protein O)
MPAAERAMRVEAVVLRHSDWGEADRMLGLYTREAGKLRAVAKGARKLRSRKAGHLEPFTRVTLMLARGHDYWIITQAETVDAYLPLREDLVTTGYAAYIIELLDRFSYEEGENRGLYSLLVDTLARLSSGEDPFLAVRYYEVRLLDTMGFRPQLFRCVEGAEEIKAEDQFFSAQGGGVLCPRHGRAAPEARPVSTNALRFMRHFQRSSYADAARAQVPMPVQQEMETLLNYYLTYLLERGLNTPQFIKAMKRKVTDDRT